MTGRHATAHIVVGLAWGDEGKGATVDALAAHQATDRVVRFNGGQQAAHNVIAGGHHHTFASYGSATMSGVPTWIAGYCTVEPSAALREMRALTTKGFNPTRLNVDQDCLVTTPLHIAANLAREAARGTARHGSTGRGFGETIAYSLDFPRAAPRVRDLADPTTYLAKIQRLADHYWRAQGLLNPDDLELNTVYQQAHQQTLDAAAAFNPVTSNQLLEELSHGHTIFEGAQGFWLDENFGFQPHTTWSTTTPANARRLARAAGIGQVTTIGCLRTYATRHGAGPMPGEGMLNHRPSEPHNSDTSHAGRFRVGQHDPDLIRGALDIVMPDGVSVGHLDECSEFQTIGGPMPIDSFAPVLVSARGPNREDRTMHRALEDAAA